jgi:hypothetical protein
MRKRFILALISVMMVAGGLLATTVKISYRATNTALTVTSLQSLAYSSTSFWASAFVDNSTNLDIDEIVKVVLVSNSSGVFSTGFAQIFVYDCSSNTTTCSDGVSGSQGTYTPNNPTNLVKGPVCNIVAISTTYQCPGFSVAGLFSGTMPVRWGVAIENQSGAAFAAAGNAVTYDSVQLTNQ